MGGGGGWKRSTNLAIFFVGMLGHHTRVKFPIDVKFYSINTDDNQDTTLTFLSSRVIDSNKVPFFSSAKRRHAVFFKYLMRNVP